MMVKVIERHTPKDERIGRFRCLNCKSVIETTQQDIVKWRRFEGDRPFDPSGWEIPCPVCSQMIASLWRVDE